MYDLIQFLPNGLARKICRCLVLDIAQDVLMFFLRLCSQLLNFASVELLDLLPPSFSTTSIFLFTCYVDLPLVLQISIFKSPRSPSTSSRLYGCAEYSLTKPSRLRMRNNHRGYLNTLQRIRPSIAPMEIEFRCSSFDAEE